MLILVFLENIKEISSQPDVVLMGDFNAPSSRWNDLQAQSSKFSFDHRLLKTTLEDLFTQHVFVPTRARGGKQTSCLDLVFIKDPNSIDEVNGQQTSCLDLVFIKDPNSIDEVNCLPPLGRSDHAVLSWEYGLYSVPFAINETTPNLWRGDFCKMRTEASRIDRDLLFSGNVTED
ncbi:unnamed protein product [Schistocephalus solidus]|uniref:Endo/exonuclease/phosphatase domain-containing protein n=1 Tax=Schistocephalus solidus TaxID=70667 RepID=A0A183TRQ8_SCHSO|nr:unnamed protein product [Schistocephalus solidus]